MTIETVETWTVELPLARPVQFGAMRFDSRDYAIVRVRDESGAEGFGYGMARNGPIAAAVAKLAPLVVGADPWMSERLWADLYKATITYGQRGVALRALSLIDIALWDLRARLAGVPLYRMFGGWSDDVLVSVGGGYFREHRSSAEIDEELRSYVKRGFRHVKIPAGGAAPPEEQAWVGAARESIGVNVELAVDAHWTWADVPTARDVIERWEPFRLAWVEDPLWPEAVSASRRLRSLVRTPIAIGDEQSGRWAYQNLVDGQAADIWRVDVTTVGGFSEFRRVAALAAAWGIPISTHIYPELHVHCAAAEPSVLAVEYVDPVADIDLSHHFVTRPAQIEDGRMSPPTEPGLGFDLDWAMIEQVASERFAT